MFVVATVNVTVLAGGLPIPVASAAITDSGRAQPVASVAHGRSASQAPVTLQGTGARLATLLAAKKASSSPVGCQNYVYTGSNTTAPVIGNNCLDASSAPSYVQSFEQNAVNEVLAGHNLPASDYDKVLALARDDVRTQEWADLANIIMEQPSARSAQDQQVYAWFQALDQQEEVSVLQAAVNEYLKWSGLTMGTINNTPFGDAGGGTGYCNYVPPANSPAVSDNPTDQGDPIPSCFGCPEPDTCLLGPTYPSPNDFVTWGQTDAVDELLANVNSTDYAASQLDVYAAAGMGATLAAIGIATPLASALAGTSLAGTALQTTLFPFAARAFYPVGAGIGQGGAEAAAAAEEVPEAASAVTAASAAFVIGVAIFAAVTIAFAILQIVENAAVANDLVQALQNAQTTPPDLHGLLTSSDSSTQQNAYNALLQLFLRQTMPDVAYNCLGNSVDPCIQTPTPPAINPSTDPEWDVWTQSSSGWTPSLQTSIYAQDATGGVFTNTRMSGGGWFVSTKYDDQDPSNLSAPTHPGVTVQTLQFPFTDWAGKHWVAEREANAFVLTPMDTSSGNPCAPSTADPGVSACYTATLDIQEPNGTDVIAQLDPPTGPPAVTASVPSTASSNFPTTVTADASGGTPPYTYSWYVPDNGSSGETFTGQTTQLTFDTVGNQSISLTVTDSRNVKTTQWFSISVLPPPPTVTVTSSSPAPFVTDETVTFTANVAYDQCWSVFAPFSGGGGYTYCYVPLGSVQFFSKTASHSARQLHFSVRSHAW
jgi:hypothetical protein